MRFLKFYQCKGKISFQFPIYSGKEIESIEKNNFDNIRIWFNNKGWASSVAYMNAVNNIVLRAGVQEAGGSHEVVSASCWMLIRASNGPSRRYHNHRGHQ